MIIRDVHLCHIGTGLIFRFVFTCEDSGNSPIINRLHFLYLIESKVCTCGVFHLVQNCTFSTFKNKGFYMIGCHCVWLASLLRYIIYRSWRRNKVSENILNGKMTFVISYLILPNKKWQGLRLPCLWFSVGGYNYKFKS